MASPSSRTGTKGVPRAVRERQILDAATEEFGRRGYAAASLAAVAGRVGVTKTLLHQYFGAKQDLCLACLVPVGDRVLEAVRTATADHGDGAPPDPVRVLHGLFTALEGCREGWFVLYDPALPADGEAARRARRYRAEIDRLAAAGAARLVGASAAPQAEAALDADALTYAWRGVVTALVRWWIKHPGQSPEQMARRCARLFAAAGAVFAPGVDQEGSATPR
ncbi:TetR/AcrR family transcriptional regulator [Streptomyces solincola]|uniref:TetR/AcrR family transcriptional regulator n=1 Tax=Streptomyces solincola TaxID=2100817 RepID=A0A2S9PY43_9ACTN|nr:TetR/AcrR family transcriptional regulator [Streptomyces solincola]PRH79338.1 TetR/AcrR family transcriptional regulator [Streptomyces solincola]